MIDTVQEIEKMNYEVIKDEKLLLDFIDWLPELNKDEVFYLCLFARSKYCKDIVHISSDKAQLRRYSTDKSFMLNRIRQMECKIGSFTHKGVVVPQEALAVYINPNPRNLVSAAWNGIERLQKLVRHPYNGYNPQAEMMSEIQKAMSRKVYLDLDFDIPDVADKEMIEKITIAEVKEIVGSNSVKILKTRGGFHALIKLELIDKRNSKWYKEVTSLKYLDIKGDSLIPVPGCTQGNFTPHFL